MAGELSVAVVGLGSRGLSVLERIVTLARRAGAGAGRVRVEVIDPICDGAGLHTTDQPDYLLLNTICSHVSMFPDTLSVGEDIGEAGPSLFEWVTARGLRLAPDGYTLGTHGRPVSPDDYLPRRILGEYLSWFLDGVLRGAPDHVEIKLHRTAAADLAPEPGGGFRVTLAGGTAVHTGFVFLTTGYTANAPVPARPRQIREAWRRPVELDRIEPGQTVALGGFGLTAMDIMAALTVGRGGRFTADGYVASGEEPVLLLHSRTGLPHLARPALNRPGGQYVPIVFSTRSVDALRGPQRRRLDFDADVMPLVLTEMRISYHRTRVALADGAEAEQSLVGEIAHAWESGLDLVGKLLDELDGALDGGLDGALDSGLDGGRRGYDPAAALDGSAGMDLTSGPAYQSWLTGFIADDLAQARLGLAGSPVKSAIDILRELRDVVRYVVDFGGLTDASLDRFMRHTVPIMNRAVVGPQKERYAELLALVDAGVLRAPFGPEPAIAPNGDRWTITSTRLLTPCREDVDWRCDAHVSSPAVDTSTSPLIASLFRQGLVRRHRPASDLVCSIDLDPDQHPVDVDGRAEPRLWVLGPLCEGTTFYNHLVPSPAVYSRPLSDAHRCVKAMLESHLGSSSSDRGTEAPQVAELAG